MSTQSEFDTENPFRHPLGLPNGSVRALMTMIVVAVTCADIVAGNSIEPVWTETLMVALAYYFTSRRFLQLPPEVLQKLESDGIVPKEPLPLYLPRGTIRLAILVTFLSVAGYQFQHGKLFEKETFPIFITLLAYFAGTTVRGMLNWWYRGRNVPSSRWWADTKAITVLGALALTATLQVIGQQHLAPIWLENITMAMVLFYFGSR
ncbi:MAG: hypothetical protein JWM11_5084 [Planctomycetaceae bacterium]|nr:hypothetical protein [Planctomycetaceae bacterium]